MNVKRVGGIIISSVTEKADHHKTSSVPVVYVTVIIKSTYLTASSLHKIKPTTVNQPKFETGEICTELLLKLIRKQKVTERFKILYPELVIRNTCRVM